MGGGRRGALPATKKAGHERESPADPDRLERPSRPAAASPAGDAVSFRAHAVGGAGRPGPPTEKKIQEAHMTRTALSLGLLLSLLACAGAPSKESLETLRKENETLRAENARLAAAAAPLPASLDRHYPPNADRPVFLGAMHGLAAKMTAVPVALELSDRAAAQKSFEEFRGLYAEVSKMVPEWTADFPQEPVEQFGKALASGDPAQLGNALMAVGKVCADCHHRSMAPAQQRFHWADFAAVEIADPVTKAKSSFAAEMRALDAGLVRIGVHLEAGRPAQAVEAASALKSRMVALREACLSCHDSERAYYVDDATLSILDDLAKAISSGRAEPQQIQGLTMKFGDQACGRCHLVHVPAAFSPARKG